MLGFVEWFLDGLGPMLLGLAVGGAGGAGITLRVMTKTSQRQRAGDNARQHQSVVVRNEQETE